LTAPPNGANMIQKGGLASLASWESRSLPPNISPDKKEMPSYRVKDLAVTIEKEGADSFTKATYPIRFGRYSEIRTQKYEFHFNLRGQIRFIRGLGADWRHPGELLKRTDGNDWVYYSLGSVGEHIVSWLGEYYLPCPTYGSNAIYEYNPFADPVVMSALGAWGQLYGDVYQMDRNGLPEKVQEFFDLIQANDDNTVFQQAEKFHEIIGQRLSVLPPDTRHVDYEVIPLTIADGCRYHCGFCCVKSPQAFQARTLQNIREQIRELKDLYGPDAGNYKALFLGNHDALGAGEDLLLAAASEALQEFAPKDPVLFLFGSVDSLIEAEGSLLEGLNKAADHTYINIGLESAHTPTLKSIRKPLDDAQVKEAFQKMLQINDEYEHLEVTANFLLGEKLAPEHNQSLMDLLQSPPASAYRKGAVYLSPLMESQKKREMLKTFFEIKAHSKLPVYVYLIQRL
jgi:hypothetical protein